MAIFTNGNWSRNKFPIMYSLCIFVCALNGIVKLNYSLSDHLSWIYGFPTGF